MDGNHWKDVGQAIMWLLIGAGAVVPPWLADRKRRKALERAKDPWDGATERRVPLSGLSGHVIVRRIEDDKADLPRHWEETLKDVIVHKLNSEMQGPRIRLEMLQRRLDEMAEEAKEDRAEVRAELASFRGQMSHMFERVVTEAQSLSRRMARVMGRLNIPDPDSE